MSLDEQQPFDDVAPDPSAMIESMRAYGYSLSAAIADLVDNSIAAAARSVWIDFHWDGSDSWVSIEDDGVGMDENELRNAMRLGSQSPIIERGPRDLGRFGLGLKTASFSQCRRLTVLSKVPAGEALRRWDLDHLARPETSGWELLRVPHPDSLGRLEFSRERSSGTLVLWETLDRLVGSSSPDDERALENFNRLVTEVETHLGMVFHRYLSRRSSPLRLSINGHDIVPWDPFLEFHPATQRMADDLLHLTSFDEPIHIKGFVLPHKDKLGEEAHRMGSGPAGWNAQQGFYLYRNERLILSGSWLGLGGHGGGRAWTQEEHYKLARIRLDVPNSMDHLWHLDVKKSYARPPASLRIALQDRASRVRQEARRVFAHRGAGNNQKGRARELARPWKVIRKGGGVGYKIDRQHPMVIDLLGQADSTLKESIQSLLRVLEETVPVQQIWLDMAENPGGHLAPFELAEDLELRRTIQIAYQAMQRNGLCHEECLKRLVSHEEFGSERAFAIIQMIEECENP